MASQITIDYGILAVARESITHAHDAVDMKEIRGLEHAPSARLRRAVEQASDYATGALALAAMQLISLERQLFLIEQTFRELDATQAQLAGTGTGDDS